MKRKLFFQGMMILTLVMAGCRKNDNVQKLDYSKISLPENMILEMVKINPGSFIRKWNPDKLSPERNKNIQSYYSMEIVLTKPYWIGKFEVTQAQYQKIMKKNPATPQRADLPVNNIRWQDAKDFCNQLNKLYAGKLPAGYQFDLPSEAQWEYAAHAGNTESPGYLNMADHAWYKDNSQTIIHPVGKKSPNSRGIHDMSGNVAEWCRDFYNDYSNVDEPFSLYSCWKVTNPVENLWNTARVLRGGSFSSSAEECWAAVRQKDYDNGKNNSHIGFRIALVPIENNVRQTMTFTLDNGSTLDLVQITEGLQHPFWIGKYEVTQEIFEAIMGYNPSKIKGNKNPVDSVSHDDALKFCKKLTEYFYHQLPEQHIFHLPFNYMWEYACQAGTTSPYNAGYDSISEKLDLNDFIWHKGNSRKGHHPAGLKRPNRWGLYDMHGNVREWCFVTDLDNELIVVRGGGWKDDLKKCTSLHREHVEENQTSEDLGFRVILVEKHVMAHY